MRLQEIMNRNVEKVAPGDTADLAWNRMRERRIHHLVVADRGSVVGVVSYRDLGGPRGVGLRRNRAVRDIMSPLVVSAQPTTTVRQAANLLRGHHIGCLPVLDRGRISGIVTVSDLLELIGRGTERAATGAKRLPLKHHKGPRTRAEAHVKR